MFSLCSSKPNIKNLSLLQQGERSSPLLFLPYCHRFAQSVKEQEKFITWAFFLPPSPLLTHWGETKLRRQASGGTITGPLLFQSWGHPSAQRSRNKGQGFIAGSTVWKETHSNIVWFSEIVDRHPCCFLCMVYTQTLTIEQVGWHLNQRIFFFFSHVRIFCSNFVQSASCLRVLQPRCRAWQFSRVGMSSPFSLTRWRASEGIETGVGEGRPKSESHRSGCRVVFFCTFSPRWSQDFQLLCQFICSVWCLTWKLVTSWLIDRFV